MSREPHADRDPVMKAIKDRLLRWTCERHATDCPLDRHLLRDKALELADEHGLTGFKCSDRWLTHFLKRHGFSLDPNDSSGPVFHNYRFWIDAMRSVITQYKHKDFFHLDELTMYSDVSPAGVSSAMFHSARRDAPLKKTTVLMCCNAAGTEKLPLLICGTYPAALKPCEDHVYTYNEDASISDELFREWLSRLNDRMTCGERKILLLLHRDRVSAFQGLELSNVRHIFFPENFPLLLKPLKRDVFHFVKMIYRTKYVEGIKKHGCRWNVENVVESLLEAWQKVPRALIIASFQRTNFRTDDCFLEIHCDMWQELEAGMSFERFVTFDDDLSTLREQRRTSGHNYNLRTSEEVTLLNDKFDPGRELPVKGIFDESQAEGDSKRIHGKVDIDRKKRNKKKNSLKRSHEEIQLDEDVLVETTSTTSTDNSITDPAQQSKSHKEVAAASLPAKRPKITFYVAKRRQTDANTRSTAKFEETNPTALRINVNHGPQAIDDTINCQKARSGSSEVSGSGEQRSMESSRRIDASNAGDFTSQQVLDDISIADSATGNPNTSVVSAGSPGNEAKSSDAPATDGNDGHSSRQSPKRRRSRSVDVEEPLDYPDEGEPARKKSRSDCDWAKRYETTFVFGPSDLALADAQQSRPKQPCEVQNIFTIRPRKD